MIEPFVHRLRVRYVECDMQGHVFNAHYLTYFDIAHTELLRATIGDYRRLIEHGLDVLVAEARVRFRAPARFDDELAIGVSLDPLTTTSMTSRFDVRVGETTVTEGELRHVCVDATTHRKHPWPDWLRAAVAPHVVGAAGTATP